MNEWSERIMTVSGVSQPRVAEAPRRTMDGEEHR